VAVGVISGVRVGIAVFVTSCIVGGTTTVVTIVFGVETGAQANVTKDKSIKTIIFFILASCFYSIIQDCPKNMKIESIKKACCQRTQARRHSLGMKSSFNT
jgi:hypothetical protein